ncbi:MAG: KH domain-containing protein [Chlamydiae bacterium]|nr:KH domain-containing protein [Chlamydiota bacterium]
MKEFVEYIVKNLVDNPQDINVGSFEGERGMIIEIRVPKKDIGKVVGRQGNTIKALRTIVTAISARLGKHVRLELIEPDVITKNPPAEVSQESLSE